MPDQRLQEGSRRSAAVHEGPEIHVCQLLHDLLALALLGRTQARHQHGIDRAGRGASDPQEPYPHLFEDVGVEPTSATPRTPPPSITRSTYWLPRSSMISENCLPSHVLLKRPRSSCTSLDWVKSSVRTL